MRVLAFGTYDATVHPRVAIIAAGLAAAGAQVDTCNAPLGLSTADRVAMLRRPWRVPLLAVRLAARWTRLARLSRRVPVPDVVLVGYLGHFDVHLARLLFRGTPVVLDHLVGASDTARDRGVPGGLRQRLLVRLDAAALRAATVVVVDTQEQAQALPAAYRDRAVVVPVGAPADWFAAGAHPPVPGTGPLKVVFYGLYTPLHGAPVIGAALGALAGAPVAATMIGRGQDAAVTRAAAAANPDVTWLDWVPAADLPALVAGHDVCLGIFGTGPKALRVVPNKVYQGAAAGTAVVTSDTAPQRRMLAGHAVLVPPGDPLALATALRELAGDAGRLAALRAAARDLALRRFTPASVVAPLLARLAPAAPEATPAGPA